MRISVVVLMTVAFFLGASARAQESGVFTETAEIEDQSAAELDIGAKKALLSLLRSLTLETDQRKLAPILSQTKGLLKQAIFLGESQDFFRGKQRVSYDFDAQAVTQAIFGAGLGLVPNARPRPLLWWVTREPDGHYGYLDVNQDADLIASAKAALREFRLDFDLPLYDLTDTLAVNPDALWQGQALPIARAMLRYAPQTQRIVKWAKLADDRVLLSVLSLDDGRLNTQLESVYPSQEVALMALIEALARTVRNGLAVVADDTDLPEIVIDGLKDFQDYRRIIRLLESNVFVESVQVQRLTGQSLTLTVESPASAQQFKQILQDSLGLKFLELNDAAMRFEVSR